MLDSIEKWLEQLSLGQYAATFAENDIDVAVLPDLTDGDLEKLEVSMGHRKRILRAIGLLTIEHSATIDDTAVPTLATETEHPSRHLEAERRQLTLMFCDLIGSTELSGKLDPEDFHEVIRAYQEACTHVVKQFEGVVARYMGDGILAYFGYPQAHEDDAERAVRAGLGIVETVARMQPRPGLSLQVRVGIATGLVVVGDTVGEGVSEEWAASGETPNLAARLQALAPDDSVVISENSRRVLGRLFEYEDLGRRSLKGFSEPVRAWRVVGPAPTASRFAAMRDQWLTPLFGREEELDRLLRRWSDAKGGSGHVVLISGEPGIGKSRIVESIREQLHTERHTQLTFQSSPLHRNSTLYPVVVRLGFEAGLGQAQSDEAKLTRLEEYLRQSPGVQQSAIVLLAELLSIPTNDRYPRPVPTPQKKKDQTLSAIIELMDRLSKNSPVLTIFEDVQWLDPTSLELLDRLIHWTQSAHALTILTYRPNFSAPWVGQSHVALIALSRLTQQQAAMMVEALSIDSGLSAAFVQEIVSRTDGIPLFIEELTKTILESDSLVPDAQGDEFHESSASLSIPSTLQDSLMARLDQLSTAKNVAQLGAMIGREFSYELLSRIASFSEFKLKEALDRLTKSGLVFRHGEPPNATYIFKHALVRDVAYQSLLNSVRENLHVKIAEALDGEATEALGRNAEDRTEVPPELVAYHYLKGRAWRESLRCWKRATEEAFARSAHVEALSHIDQALEAVERLDETTGRKILELELVTQRGAALRSIRGYAASEVAKVYLKARELCLEVGNVPERFGAEWQQMQFFLVSGDRRMASELSTNLLDYAEQHQGRALLLDAHLAKGMTLFHLGDFVAARKHLEQGVTHSRDESDRPHLMTHGQEPGVFCLSYLGYVLWFLGYPDQAMAHVGRALEIAAKRAHPFSRVSALTFAARVYQCRRDLEKLKEVANKIVSLSHERGFAYYEAQGLIHRGWAVVTMEQDESGLTQMLAGYDALEKTGTILGLSGALVQLVDAYLRLGLYDRALSAIDNAQSEKAGAGTRCWDAELARLRGELLAKSPADELRASEIWYRKALETARRQHAKSLELRAAMSYAKSLRAQGRSDEARKEVRIAFEGFPEAAKARELAEARAFLNE